MKTSALLIVVMMSVTTLKASAQQVIQVPPGYGTLNDSLAADGGNKVYELKAGGWYGLNAIIEIDAPVTIIGEAPASGQMPAMIQNGSTSSGTVFDRMFNVNANFTVRNVFMVNADLDNAVSNLVIVQNAAARIVLDSVTVDPIGYGSLIAYNTDTAETYITNCLLMQHGSPTALFDGFMWQYNGTTGLDTLYVENNTFVDVGLNFFLADSPWQRGAALNQDNFLWFNHNTIMFAKSDLMNDYLYKSLYFTNNLMWQVGFVPFTKTDSPNPWFYNFGDVGPKNILTGLVKADTLPGETLPTQRKCFAEYNYNYRDTSLSDIIALGLDSGRVSYLLPIVQPASVKDSCRQAWIFSDKTDFPNFKAGNNIDDQPNTDPNFVDSKIYTLTDSSVVWAKYAEENFWGFPTDSYPPSSDWPDYYYRADTVEGNPTTWPRFDGAYSNPQLLTASIEGLPLGDLNWFPQKKALWEQYKAQIMQRILSENETQWDITSVSQTSNRLPTQFALSQNYPNPFNPTTEISYSVAQTGLVTLKVYNVLGQEVTTLYSGVQRPGSYVATFDGGRLASGVYFYTLQEGANRLTRKLVLLK